MMQMSVSEVSLVFPLLALTAALSSQVIADDNRDPFLGVRPAGMGNAFTALASDQNAAWTNPAGISRVRKARSRPTFSLIHVPGIILGFNKKGRSFYEALQAGKALNTDQAVNFAQALASVRHFDTNNTPLWGRSSFSFLANFDAPKGTPWGIAGFTNTTLQLRSDLEDPLLAIVDTVNDLGAALTFAWTNRVNRFTLGLQVRGIKRYAYYEKLSVSDLLSTSNLKNRIQNESNQGTGVGVDLGVLWTFADFWFPTVGLAWRNLPIGCVDDYLNSFEELRQSICGTVFQGQVQNPDAPSLIDPSDLRLGISITPRIGHKWALRVALDLHNLYISMGTNKFAGLPGMEPIEQAHAGIELFIGNPLLLNPIAVRMGYSQGYISSGASLRLGFLLVEAAVYGYDLVPGTGSFEDRRILLNLAAEFI